jgi:hypothetical protein
VAVTWLENVNGNGSSWTVRTIATATVGITSTAAADLDSDGDVDLIADVRVGFDGRATWYENAAGDGSVWTERTIGATAGQPTMTIVDVDGDGQPDVVAASYGGGRVEWFRNQSIHETACFVRQPDIATAPDNAGTTIQLATADLDGDGDGDVLAGALEDSRLVSFRNLSGSGDTWASQLIATSNAPFRALQPADFDGDGDVDFVSNPGQDLRVFRNLAAGSVWDPSSVATPAVLYQSRGSAEAVDLDADGDVDILTPIDSVGLMWFENAGDGITWTRRTVAAGAPSFFAYSADVDGDADADVLTTANDGAILWYENAGAAGAWIAHTVSRPGMGAIRVGDVDGDGDPDVLTSTSGTTLLWLENAAGNGSVWTTHTVGTLPASALWTDAGDLDGDGDLDGLATVFSSIFGLVWYENLGGGSGWVRHSVLGTTTSLTHGRLGDLDGDGAPDVLTSAGSNSTIGWARNEPGQVLFDVADQVPASANNNDVFSALRLTVTHGGRAGDSDLELARLGLRFRAADLLTSTEANALVEELRVYRDGNGNGTFDPGTDTLVTTVATLALTNGVQTIPFADGDPNVRVAFGAPAAFFVVVQLTANASEQVPNQFRIAHLATGPSATLAEDASADLPLRAACPADFESRIIGPVVPVELMGFTVE